MSSIVAKSLKAGVWVAGGAMPRLGTRLAVRYYRRAGMRIYGDPMFIAHNVWFDSSKNYRLITLHEGCTLSRDVRVLTHDWSPYRTLRALGRTDTMPVGKLEEVVVGPHAFIGMGAILLPGAVVGKGAIVGAGAVVRGSIPDYAICIGNPATCVGDAREYVRRKFPLEWESLPVEMGTAEDV